MKLKKWRLQLLAMALTLCLVLGYYPGAIAHRDRSASRQLLGQEHIALLARDAPKERMEDATRLHFTMPPKGAPGDRGGDGTRSLCEVDGKPPFTALVPGTHIGFTVAERPTFWFYLPFQPNSAPNLEFLLVDNQENSVYENTFPLTATPGIVSISLPPNVRPLEVGKRYHWTLNFTCDRANRREILATDAAVERVPLEPALKRQLDTATPRERIFLYAANGLWHDTLTNLIELRRQNPQDPQLAKDWEDLLRQSPEIALPYIIPEPVVPCCKPKR